MRSAVLRLHHTTGFIITSLILRFFSLLHLLRNEHNSALPAHHPRTRRKSTPIHTSPINASANICIWHLIQFGQISIHYILSFTHESYGRATSLSNLKDHIYGVNDDLASSPPIDTGTNSGSGSGSDPDSEPEHLAIDKRANATFVILCRNSDVDGTVRSVREIEDRFNRRYRYPYVLLNEVPFTEEFKKSVLSPDVFFFRLMRNDRI